MGGSTSSQSKSKTCPNKSNHTPTITSLDRAILDLKNARDRLRRYQAQLEVDQCKLTTKALEFQRAGKQKSAIHVMKLRQHRIQEVANVDAQLWKVYEMTSVLGAKIDEGRILDALKEGTRALKHLHEEKSVDDVLKIMEDAQEEIDIENEVCGIMGVDLNDLNVDVLNELEKMEMELHAQEVNVVDDHDLVDDSTSSTQKELPVAPSARLPSIEQKDASLLSNDEHSVTQRVAVSS